MFMNADGGYRFSLGFNYVSFASQRMFFALCSYLMFRGKKITYMELLALFLATIYMYQQTSTSSPFYLSILIPVSYTHLDVYKRQVMSGFVRSGDFQSVSIGNFLSNLWLNMRIF